MLRWQDLCHFNSLGRHPAVACPQQPGGDGAAAAAGTRGGHAPACCRRRWQRGGAGGRAHPGPRLHGCQSPSRCARMLGDCPAAFATGSCFLSACLPAICAACQLLTTLPAAPACPAPASRRQRRPHLRGVCSRSQADGHRPAPGAGEQRLLGPGGPRGLRAAGALSREGEGAQRWRADESAGRPCMGQCGAAGAVSCLTLQPPKPAPPLCCAVCAAGAGPRRGNGCGCRGGGPGRGCAQPLPAARRQHGRAPAVLVS